MPDGSLVIGAAGIYHGVDMALYLECTAVGASDLWNLHNRCPAYAIARHASHPNPEPDRESAALALGELTHALILEGEDVVKARYVVKPEDMSFATKEGKAWRIENGDRTIISAADMEAAYAFRNAILNNKQARMALEGTDREVTILATDRETGLPIKSRPDAMRANLAVNIKTTSNATPRWWESDARKYGYHVSEAMTALCLRMLDAPPRPYVFAVIEKAARNPIVQLYTLPDTTAALGEAILRKSLRRWAKCAEVGDWPPYEEGVYELPAPRWAVEELEQLQREEA